MKLMLDVHLDPELANALRRLEPVLIRLLQPRKEGPSRAVFDALHADSFGNV